MARTEANGAALPSTTGDEPRSSNSGHASEDAKATGSTCLLLAKPLLARVLWLILFVLSLSVNLERTYTSQCEVGGKVQDCLLAQPEVNTNLLVLKTGEVFLVVGQADEGHTGAVFNVRDWPHYIALGGIWSIGEPLSRGRRIANEDLCEPVKPGGHYAPVKSEDRPVEFRTIEGVKVAVLSWR